MNLARRKQYEANKIRIRRRNLQYYYDHIEQFRKYYKKNRKIINARCRRYYHTHKDKFKALHKKYAEQKQKQFPPKPKKIIKKEPKPKKITKKELERRKREFRRLELIQKWFFELRKKPPPIFRIESNVILIIE
jgi:hypothetical protein